MESCADQAPAALGGEPGTEELRQEVTRPQGIPAHHNTVGHSVQNTAVPFTDSHSKATKMKETQPRAGGCQITECCSQEPAVALNYTKATGGGWPQTGSKDQNYLLTPIR